MIEAKTFEIRDRATFLPVLAIWVRRVDWHSPEDNYLLGRLGWGISKPGVYLLATNRGTFQDDPNKWGDRTYQTAHQYILDNWVNLRSGTVIDVEYILGETNSPKRSERLDEVC